MNVQTMTTFFALLTVGANLFVVGVVALWLAGRASPAARDLGRRIREGYGDAALPVAWIVALVATAGSLYYSEVAHLPPCTLCWYQRIGMYPFAVILGVAALKRDAGIKRYVLPIVLPAAAISVYHYQLEWFPNQTSLVCSLSVPCSQRWFLKFQYISLPFMALSAFALIAVLVLAAQPWRGEDEPASGQTSFQPEEENVDG